MLTIARTVTALLATGAMVGAALPAAAADKVGTICVSRIYDYLKQPVTAFAVDFHQTELIGDGEYASYKAALAAAAAPLGYDPANRAFTLHETLTAFPFLYYGQIYAVVLVLCAAGGERDNLCRRADYYVRDHVIDAGRLSLIIADTLTEPEPAPVDSCDFGQGDWSALDAG